MTYTQVPLTMKAIGVGRGGNIDNQCWCEVLEARVGVFCSRWCRVVFPRMQCWFRAPGGKVQLQSGMFAFYLRHECLACRHRQLMRRCV